MLCCISILPCKVMCIFYMKEVTIYICSLILQNLPQRISGGSQILQPVSGSTPKESSEDLQGNAASPQISQKENHSSANVGKQKEGTVQKVLKGSVQTLPTSPLLKHQQRGGELPIIKEEKVGSPSSPHKPAAHRSTQTHSLEHNYAATPKGDSDNPIVITPDDAGFRPGQSAGQSEPGPARAQKEQKAAGTESKKFPTKLKFPFERIHRQGEPMPSLVIPDPFGTTSRPIPEQPSQHWNPARPATDCCSCNGCWLLRIEYHTQRRGFIMDRVQECIDWLHSVAHLLHHPVPGLPEQLRAVQQKLAGQRHKYYENENLIRSIGNERFCTSVYWRKVSECLLNYLSGTRSTQQ